MGYYSTFELEIRDLESGKEVTSDVSLPIIEKFRHEKDFASYCLDEDGSSSGEESKWYEAEDDLSNLSKDYPKLLFVLYGHGEDEERWVTYANNGKYYTEKGKVKVTYPKFNIDKL